MKSRRITTTRPFVVEFSAAAATVNGPAKSIFGSKETWLFCKAVKSVSPQERVYRCNQRSRLDILNIVIQGKTAALSGKMKPYFGFVTYR